MADREVRQVTVCDLSQEQLDECGKKLRQKPGADKLVFNRLDVTDDMAAAGIMAEFDAIVAALPRPINVSAIRAALAAGTPLVDLTQIPGEVRSTLEEEMETAGRLIVLGCGVEPGLTEIMARHLAEQMDQVDELHIKCGGIPEKPLPPLGYKIVFGGRRLPLREFDSTIVQERSLRTIPRYSGVESVTFSGVGECEAWHEGFMPWLLDIPALQNLRLGTQKTVRWPGYAAKVNVLKEMGLLSHEPIKVDSVSVVPKHLLDALLYPKVRLEEGERDITCFRVELMGTRDGRPCRYQADMVDRYDDVTGFTSMARTTAYTGAIVARMIARGEITAGEKPITTPEQVITGTRFDRLMDELKRVNIRFDVTLDWNWRQETD
jgi:saccharopine dehydrogenase-like NADP-dependent oxidoreductase